MNNNYSTKALGEFGENEVVKYLKHNGCQILNQNYYSRYGEIDIIAKENNILAFVEVKTRGSNPIAAPREAVTKTKQKKIVKTALCYLTQHTERLQPRFDVAEVIVNRHNMTVTTINYIKNAFMPEGDYASF